ncbi:MAG: VanZ family protein [Bacilli bacterium]|nr:VanZ family protein [Bacilli bacterium]
MKKKIFSFIFYAIAGLFLMLYLIADRSATLHLSEFGRLFLLCGSCLFLYFGGLLLSKYKNNTKPMKINLWIFFGLYLLLLVTLTLFDSVWGRNGINIISANAEYKQYFENTVNLIPFKTIIEYITEFDSMYSTSTILFNLLGNLVALMPMAFFLPLLFKKQNKFKNFALTTAGIILLIEFLQLITSSGRFDIDDLILNLSGALILYGIIKIKSVNNLIRNIFLLEKNKISKHSYIKIFSCLFIVILTFILLVAFRNKLYDKNLDDYTKKMNPRIEIVDETETCDEALEKFYEDDFRTYYFSCIKSNNVYAIINGEEKYLVKDILNTKDFKYNIDIDKLKLKLEEYNVKYYEEDKYNKINFNIDINCDNDVCGSPENKAFVGNENKLEVKFDNRNSIFDTNKYNIDLYLIPKESGTSNLEVIFKDYNSEKQTKYLYKVTIDENLNTTYELLKNN